MGSFFCASHILAISLYLIKWRTPEEENKAHTNVINKLRLLPLSPSRSEQDEEMKTSLYFQKIGPSANEQKLQNSRRNGFNNHISR
jgi:hypothetical protein